MEIKKGINGIVYVPGATKRNSACVGEMYDIFEQGITNRHTASTKINSKSSRSHLILSILVTTTNKLTQVTYHGKFSIIDLAGSERILKSGATGEVAKEAQAINVSLSALGDVISALTMSQSFIPYRNSKLTMLMQDSLGGNAKTLMFVTISPVEWNLGETISSLNYAARIKLITNEASKNTNIERSSKAKTFNRIPQALQTPTPQVQQQINKIFAKN